MSPFCGHFGPIWGKKKRVFLGKFFLPQIILFWVPDCLGPSKTKNWAPRSLDGPHLGPFCGQKGRFGGQKTRFSQKKFFAPNHFLIGSQMVWDPQKPKIGPLYPPMDPIWACSGTSGRHATRLVSHIRAQPYLTPSKGHGLARV